MFKMKLWCFIVVLCVGAGVMAGKYSREVNEAKPSGGDEKTVEFRLAKLNQVWEKALRVSDRNVPACGLNVELLVTVGL